MYDADIAEAREMEMAQEICEFTVNDDIDMGKGGDTDEHVRRRDWIRLRFEIQFEIYQARTVSEDGNTIMHSERTPYVQVRQLMQGSI